MDQLQEDVEQLKMILREVLNSVQSLEEWKSSVEQNAPLSALEAAMNAEVVQWETRALAAERKLAAAQEVLENLRQN